MSSFGENFEIEQKDKNLIKINKKIWIVTKSDKKFIKMNKIHQTTHEIKKTLKLNKDEISLTSWSIHVLICMKS